jgi:hypothetical protein
MRTLFLLLCLSLASASAQTPEFWPGAQYDPALPTVQKVLGFAPGERVATHAEIGRYFDALAQAAPSRLKIFEYGRTWERRRLFYAVLGSEANIRRIAEIKDGMKRLADPRKTPPAEARKLFASLPAVIALSYGVHGNEISSPDAAMMAAYHLLAARNDSLVDAVLRDVVILIDPLQNPDGRDRFVHNFTQNEGLEPDPFPLAAERQEPWPGGRSNHYLFDMNRDWFALTQPETRGRVKYLLDWLPLVHVDLHEMGTDSTYFFAPGAQPYNPHLTKEQKDQMSWFGRNNARWFDQFGFPYFTREVFDEFYPGYGASWPWYYGGMGMTYENASVRGLVVRKSDDSLYTFRDSVRKHFVASIATCETAHQNRARLLENFYEFNRTAVEEGRSEPVKELILPRRGDVSAVDKLAHLLAEQGVEVRRARAPFKNGDQEYPAGSYAILMAQPRKRFLRVVMDPEIPMDPEFLKEQERRRAKKLPDQIYDVTAWSLPMLYNVECVRASSPSQGDFTPIAGPYQPQGAVSGKAAVAYLVPWGSQAAARFFSAAVRADLKLLTANKPFTQNGRKYPSGTLILLVKQNSASIHDTVARLAKESGAEVAATDSSWVDDGIDFGSNNVFTVKKPAIAMVWDQPASSQSAGHTRFVIERLYNYPVTVVRAQALANADLSKFNVLIFPDSGGFGASGGYAQAFSGPALDRLKAWVRAGGVLVGIGGALGFLSSPQAALLAIQQEALARETTPPARPAEAAKPSASNQQAPATAAPAAPAAAPPGPAPGRIFTKLEDFEKAIQADRELPDAVAGVMLRARVDPELWITAGLPETLHVLLSGRAIYSPIKRDRGVNAAVFSGPEDLVASGYLWAENRKQLAYKPFVVVQNEGRGAVVGFTADPNYRAFMDGLNVLFLNAVFRGPSSTGRGGGPGELEIQ